MSSASRYNELLSRSVWVLVGGAAVIGLYLYLAYLRIFSPAIAETACADPVADPAWPQISSLASSCDWSIFQNRIGEPPPGRHLAKQFRLAGTYIIYGGGASDTRKAVLDDFNARTQHVVSENDMIGEVRIVRIFRDRIVLRDITGEEQLWLSFSRSAGRAGGSGDSGGEIGREGFVPGSTDKFGGKRIGEHRWVFKRQAVLDYYDELRQEPERLVKLFDSLKPLYDANRRITGYQLGIEGEADFFNSVGFQEGDIVRSVNDLKMTNRRQAERFIGEFINNRANAFVIDIERANKKKKLIYQVR